MFASNVSKSAVRTATFEVYEDAAGSYRWRLVAGNGEKIAASEAYTTRANARRSAEMVKRLAPDATIEDKY